MKKTGQLLREAREVKGISIQEVSVHLIINSRILRALEDGDRSHLPAKTFLRGFVQSYAQFLRLDGDAVLDLFQAEEGTTHPEMITKYVESASDLNKSSVTSPLNGSQDTTKGNSDSKKTNVINDSNEAKFKDKQVNSSQPPSLTLDHKTWSRSMKIGTGVLVIIISAIIVGVIKTIEKYEREATIITPPPLDVATVPRSEITPEVSPISSIVPEDKQEATSIETPAPIAQDVSSVTEPMAQPSPSNSVVNEQSPLPSPQINPSNLPKEDLKTALPSNEKALIQENKNIENRPQEVIIEALDKVTVEYSIDDKPRATLVLNPEKVHTFRGDKRVSLSFSDGGSVNLIHNGKDKGVPGNLGKPLKMSFPE